MSGDKDLFKKFWNQFYKSEFNLVTDFNPVLCNDSLFSSFLGKGEQCIVLHDFLVRANDLENQYCLFHLQKIQKDSYVL